MSSTIMYKELEQSCLYSHMAMCWTTMELWLDSKQEQDMCLFSKVFRPLLGNIQPAIQQVLQAVSIRAKWSKHESDHSPPSGVKVKKVWGHFPTSSYISLAWYLSTETTFSSLF